MPILRIQIEDILSDPDHPEDLSELPVEKALARVRDLYSFLPSIDNVSIEDSVVTLALPEENVHRIDEAQRTSKRAGRAAERGNYQAALEMFQEVLEVIPHHAETRRDLSMAYYELGDSQEAKRYIVQALRLQPADAWSWVVLGNIYLKFENDPERAERYYQEGYELDPTDLYLLNSYGTLKAKRGQYAEARGIFEQAIQQDPNYPNPRYGLALCHVEEGELETALLVIEETCSTSRTHDVRTDPVYEQARALYLDVNRRLAQQKGAEMIQRLKEAMERFGTESGVPIELQQDHSLKVPATTQMAWVYGRDRHVIKYQPASPEVVPHHIAHQFELIRLNQRARDAGRTKAFVSTPEQQAYAMRLVRRDADRLRRQGITGSMVDAYLQQIVDGLLNQLYNAPLELIAEHRMYHSFDFLRPSQVLSLRLIHQQNVQAVQDESIRAMSPRIVWESNVTMNCAYALYTDYLLNNATAYAEPYRRSIIYSTGRRLFETWKRMLPKFQPGDEYDLVDEYARVLKLQRWYEWRPIDEEGPPLREMPEEVTEPTPEGPTNQELLQQKEPATVMYLLDALQRFDKMDQDQVQQIAFEIALLGRSGLDYADSEKKYTLRSLPGERFSGLHLMALMYIGFKRLDPTADTSIPFDDAYAVALSMHQTKK